MQEPASSSMHIICMDLRLAPGALCYCMLHGCIVGTFDARCPTRTP